MVRGLSIFRDHFRPFEGSLTLIGGAACDEWFSGNGMLFRATNDLDLVIMTDVIAPSFADALRSFIEAGGYQRGERSEGRPLLYRFSAPSREDFPAKLEFCCRQPEGLDLKLGQRAIPISTGFERHSLSAILLNEDYFNLIRDHHVERDGLWVANATSLIPLKAHAWLNLTRDREAGVIIDTQDIKKHRSDVFRLAATLPGQPGPELPATILADLSRFLEAFPASSAEWPAILDSVHATLRIRLPTERLRSALKTYYRLAID